jgi:acyl-CoA:acyl-CoA alkyltransferase
MQFHKVCLAGLGYILPPVRISSDQIEVRLQPLYSRLRLPEGRLELMTGVRERRLWHAGTLPGDKSIRSGQMALEAAGLESNQIGALIHASVCRDHLEPATACRVHDGLNLPGNCLVYDVSNACLGLLNGMLQIACLIELGAIQAGVVVGTESSGPLLETTLGALNGDTTLTRESLKDSLASLTIGSGSCAIALCHQDLCMNGARLRTVVAYANTRHHALCHSGHDEAIAEGMAPLMRTDSETLMAEGIATGQETFLSLLKEANLDRSQIDRSICHQVGKTHRRLMLNSLELFLERDYSTVEWLGNSGSVALPTALALAAEQQFVKTAHRVCLLGIGSGINSVMMELLWGDVRVCGFDEAC